MGALVTDPLLGQSVDGRYAVVRRIARGGMATVYLAHDRRLDRFVALKVMHPHLAEANDIAPRFRREARAAARVAHPGIVAVLDQGTDGDLSYLTMEYVRGRTLRTEIAGHGALSLGQALTVTEGVLDALAAAHRAGLVHRDVKPENVLITASNTVKVGDFGLARAVTEATAASTGTLLGTVAYLSPEIVASGQADARADVYATGIMLYEMITGSTPFEGETPIQVAYRHVHEDVPAPSDSVPWLPVEVDDLVAELTARDVSQRPEDAAEALALVRRLRRGLDQRALALRADLPGRPDLLIPIPDDLPEADAHAALLTAGQTEELVDERTRALDRGPGTGTIAIPIGAVTAPEDTATEKEEAPARTRGRRGRRAVVVIAVLLLLAAAAGAAWWYLVGPGSYVAVPPVVGTDRAAAAAALEDVGLVAHVSEEYDDDAPQGEVLSADPEPGTALPRGTEVALVASLGVEHLQLEELAGMTLPEAEAALAAARFAAPEIIRENDRTVPAGTVISTDPVAGSYPHQTTVTLTVSDGPMMVAVDEDFVGTEASAAITTLAQLLDIDANSISQEEEFNDEYAAGQVVAVAIGAPGEVPAPYEVGATFPQGSIVTMVVSLGPDLVQVPRVIGKSLTDATDELEALGFVVDTKQSWGIAIGRVVDQSVTGGQFAKRGATILLTYV